jgi:hypothetical protein
VFRLYCVEEMTIEQIAKKYRSLDWDGSEPRLKLIKRRIGVDPKI